MLLTLDRVKMIATEAVSTEAGPVLPAPDGLMTGRA
jgi:hypothetical protein